MMPDGVAEALEWLLWGIVIYLFFALLTWW